MRWESPESAAKQFAKTVATPPKSGGDSPSGKSLPWRMENGEWVADSTNSLVIYAALSRDGKWLAWMEQRPNETKIVARAWKIGGDTPGAASRAVRSSGQCGHRQRRDARPWPSGRAASLSKSFIDGVRIDSLDARDRTVCLAFSPQRNWLIAGTVPGGRVRAYTVKREPTSGKLVGGGVRPVGEAFRRAE